MPLEGGIIELVNGQFVISVNEDSDFKNTRKCSNEWTYQGSFVIDAN